MFRPVVFRSRSSDLESSEHQPTVSPSWSYSGPGSSLRVQAVDRYFEAGEMSSELSRNMETFIETGQAQSSGQEAKPTVAGSYT